MRYKWNVFAQAGSILVAWIKENLQRERSFWITKISQKKFGDKGNSLKLRERTRQLIRSMGDGENYFVAGLVTCRWYSLQFKTGMVTE